MSNNKFFDKIKVTKTTKAVDLINQIEKIDQEKEKLDERKNLLLRDLRAKVGKSFRYEGKTFQIRRRGERYYLAKPDATIADLRDLSESESEDEEEGKKTSAA